MKSLVVKRSVDIDGHKTSVSLEDAFWSDLKEIARRQRATLSKVLSEIDKGRQQGATYLQRYGCSYSTKSALAGSCATELNKIPSFLTATSRSLTSVIADGRIAGKLG